MNEEAQISPSVTSEPPERPTQTAGHAGDSMVRQLGLSVVRRSAPRRVADTPQLQALLEDLADHSATISERDGIVKRTELYYASTVFPILGQKTVCQMVCTEQNFFDLQLQLCSCRSQTGKATNRMVISYLIATHFWHRWPASRVVILLNLKRVYCHLQGVSVGPNGR